MVEHDGSFRTVVDCESTGEEVVADVTIIGAKMHILHLHNGDDGTYDTTDAEDVEAFKAKFYEAQPNAIVN